MKFAIELDNYNKELSDALLGEGKEMTVVRVENYEIVRCFTFK